MARRFSIGRDKSCDVPIADESVSRRHAEIWLADDGALMLADHGSSNGTTVIRGAQRIPLRQDVLLPSDQIRFGAVLLEAQEVIDAVEAKYPGALTRPSAAPPPPPPPRAAVAPPPPPLPMPSGPVAKPALVRCECGAIKTVGQLCPGCHR